MVVKKNKTERRQFFEELLMKCQQEEVYSVIGLSKQLGIDYEQVEIWATKNHKLNDILQECRSLCAKRAKEKFQECISIGIKEEQDKYFDYWRGNDDVLAAKIEKQKEEDEEKRRLENEKRIKKEEAKRELEKEISINMLCRQKPQAANQLHASVPAKIGHEEEAKIRIWQEKYASESTPFIFEKDNVGSNQNVAQFNIKFLNENLSYDDQKKIVLANLCAATGTGGENAGTSIFTKALSTIHRNTSSNNIPHIVTAHQEALIAMKPNDIHEGMLCNRMWTLHNQAMYYMAKAAHPDQASESVDMYTNRAVKLMRLHNETLETLNRYRRKGEQKVIVTHQNVQVNDGGQAIVAGEIKGSDKKSEE